MHDWGRWGIVVAAGLGALVLVERPTLAKKPAGAEPAATERDLGALARDDVNRLAARLNLPLFWRADQDSDGAVDPDEVVGLLFYPTQGEWVAEGAFTPAFLDAYDRMVALAAEVEILGPDGPRRQALRDLYSGDGLQPLTLDRAEIVTAVLVPPASSLASASAPSSATACSMVSGR